MTNQENGKISSNQELIEENSLLEKELEKCREENRELKESAEKCKFIAENAFDIIWVFNLNKQKFTYISSSIYDMLGFTSEEALDNTFADLMDPETLNKVNEMIERRLNEFKETGKVSSNEITELELSNKNGKKIWTETLANYRYNSRNEIEIIGITRNIDEKKRTSEKLEIAEERYKLAMDAASEGIWDWDVVKDKVVFSPAFYEMLGYDRDYVHTSSDFWESRLHPDDKEKALKADQECINNKTDQYCLKYRMKTRDGDWKYILSRGKCVSRDENGKALRLVGTHVDITDLKKAEKARELSDYMFKMIAENTSDLLMIHNKDGSFEYISPTVRKLAGYTPEEYSKFDIFENIYPDDLDLVKRTLNDILSSKEDSQIEYRIFSKNKELIWIETRTQILKNDDGEIVKIITSTNDITSRKKAEQALIESEAKYRNLVETASDAIYLIDMDGKIRDANNAASKMLRKSKEEIVGLSITDIDPNFTIEGFKGFWNEYPLNEQQTFETTHINKDGTVFPVEISGKKYKVNDNIYYFGIARDITDRKKAEKELKRSEERFRKLFNNTPNIAIQGYKPEGTIHYWNNASEQFYGYTEYEAIGRNLLDLIIPSDMREKVAGLINISVERKEFIEPSEFSLMRKDGSRIDVYSSHVLIDYEDGDIELFCLDLDITERKKAEQRLIESEQRLRYIIDASPGIIYQTKITQDGERYFVFINSNLEHLTGYTVEEVMLDGEKFIDNIPEKDRKKFEKVFFESYNLLKPFKVIHRYITKDGKMIWMHNQSYPVKDPDGGVIWTGVATDITQQKESEEILNTIFENMPGAVFAHGLDGNFILVSKKAEEYLGYTKEELLNMNVEDIDKESIARDDRKNIWLEMMDSGFKTIETNHIRKDGSQYPVELNIASVMYKNEPMILAVGYDITEKKEAKKALEESEIRNRMIVENSPDSIMLFRKNHFVFASNVFYNVMGYGPEDFENVHYSRFLEYIHPDDRDEIVNMISKSHADRSEKDHFTYRMRKKDGEYIWIDHFANRKFNDEGFPEITVVLNRDVTEEKKAREELINTKNRLEISLQTMLDGMVTINMQGEIIYANPAAIKILELTKDEIAGKYYHDKMWQHIDMESNLLGEEELPVFHALVKDQVVDGFEHGITTPKGKMKWLSVNAAPLFGYEGEKLGVVASFRDVTGQKKMENKLKESIATKDKFFSIIAHDLRSPLTGIMTLSEHMAKDMKNMSIIEINEVFDSLYKSSFHLFKLLENLLQWSRVNRNVIDFNPYHYPLRDFANEAIALSDFKSSEKGINLRNRIPQDMDVYVDKKMSNTIFRNLVSNALKFSEKGGLVEISARELDDEWVEVSIKDEGVGIPLERIPALFREDVFSSTLGTRGEQGTGLGLLLCKEFVKRHGGRITIESGEGQGTTVIFTLPKS